jgi:hypothetical protein
VYRLDSRKHLLGDHDNSLDCKSASAVVEKIFQ